MIMNYPQLKAYQQRLEAAMTEIRTIRSEIEKGLKVPGNKVPSFKRIWDLEQKMQDMAKDIDSLMDDIIPEDDHAEEEEAQEMSYWRDARESNA